MMLIMSGGRRRDLLLCDNHDHGVIIRVSFFFLLSVIGYKKYRFFFLLLKKIVLVDFPKFEFWDDASLRIVLLGYITETIHFSIMESVYVVISSCSCSCGLLCCYLVSFWVTARLEFCESLSWFL